MAAGRALRLKPTLGVSGRLFTLLITFMKYCEPIKISASVVIHTHGILRAQAIVVYLGSGEG